MGRGSRHSKNAGTMGSESMTYAEMKGLGYGTVNERLGKVSPCAPGSWLHGSQGSSCLNQYCWQGSACWAPIMLSLMCRMLLATTTIAGSHFNQLW